MINRQQLISFSTITRKEITRFMRIWVQTILPPAISMSLYFLIFGSVIGSRVGLIEGVSYIAFIAPGLIMMPVITNAYANVSASFYSAKFQSSIEELLVSPTPDYLILLGYVAGGVLRGCVVSIVVSVVALFFTHLSIHHAWIMVASIILSASLFSLAGFLNGLYAKSFDDISLVPTFVLTPLTYLGGVFYSIDLLPDFWRNISLLNPILYIVNAFRYSILGISDVNVCASLIFLVVLVVVLFFLCLYLLKRGFGLRS